MKDNKPCFSALNKTPKFICEICDFTCSKNCDFHRHISTLKHVHRVNGNYIDNTGVFSTTKHTCLACNIHYKHASGLSRHKKVCNSIEQKHVFNANHITLSSSNDDMQANIILELVKQNQEFKDLLLQQSNQLLEQNKTIIEVAKNSQVNNTITPTEKKNETKSH